MKFNRLWWITILVPALAIGVFDYIRHVLLPVPLHSWPGSILLLVVIFIGASLLSTYVFRVYERRKARLLGGAKELASLNAIAHMAQQTLDLPQVADVALSKVQEVLRCDASLLFLADENTGGLALLSRRGMAGKFPGLPFKLETTEALSGQPLPKDEITYLGQNGRNSSLLGAIARTERFLSFAIIPLRSRDKSLGHVVVASRSSAALSYDRDFLMVVGNSIGGVIDNIQLLKETQKREREARALYEFATHVSPILNLDKVGKLAVEHARALLDADFAALCLLTGDSPKLYLVAQSGISEARVTVQKSSGVVDVQIPQSTPAHHIACPILGREHLQYHLAVQMKTQNKVIGDLCVGSHSPRKFTARDMALLSGLTNQAAIAVENAYLHEQAKNIAVLEERDRIAREMHDTLAQVLGYLNMKAKATRQLLASQQLSKAQAELQEMTELVDSAYSDVREAILGLRDSLSPRLGLVGTLREYLQKFSRQSGVHTKFLVRDDAMPTFSPSVEVQLIRVIQEALTNIRKHASAQNATVAFEKNGSWTEITIKDDGIGFEPSKLSEGDARGFGLRTMSERIEGVGGAVSIESTPGKGTSVTIRLPLAARGEE